MDVISTQDLVRKRFTLLLKGLEEKKRYESIMATSLEIKRIGSILKRRKLIFVTH